MGEGVDQRNQATEENVPLRLAEDQFYRALAASPRRRLLYYLLDEQESTVEELATVLCGWEATTTGTMQTSEEHAAHRRGLHHHHLPQLAETGLIDYDPDDDSVHLESLHPRVADIIRQSVEAERREES